MATFLNKNNHLQCGHSNSQSELCLLPLIWDPEGLGVRLLTGCEQVFSPSLTTYADLFDSPSLSHLGQGMRREESWLACSWFGPSALRNGGWQREITADRTMCLVHLVQGTCPSLQLVTNYIPSCHHPGAHTKPCDALCPDQERKAE